MTLAILTTLLERIRLERKGLDETDPEDLKRLEVLDKNTESRKKNSR